MMDDQQELDRAAGAALKELRRQSGLSQERLAAEVNMDQSVLSKIEREGPAAVAWRRFCAVAAALGYKVEVRFHPKPED